MSRPTVIVRTQFGAAILALLTLDCGGVLADSPPPGAAVIDPSEFFERQVRPILSGECSKCHALGARSKSGLQVNSRAGLLQGGKRGPAIDPGHADTSLLIRAVEHDPTLELKMPPGKRLGDEKIAALKQWIDQGAPWPDPAPKDGSPDQTPWSFGPVSEPAIPTVSDAAWPQSPIDHFVLARLEAERLRPAPPADRSTLLRRVYFDLIGLPPSVEELDRFLADDRPDAYENLIDRLLADPRYGERWGRHWLDLVRFCETNGLDFDSDKPFAYAYRDYVIRAVQDDLPYDQFIREHLAGDLLPARLSRDGSQNAAPLGTGFFWFAEMLEEDNNPQEEVANEIENQIDALGKCFLGMTLACARCHDHKFDPIRQSDYAAIAATLTRTANVTDCLDSPARTQLLDDTLRRIAILERDLQALRPSQADQELARLARCRDEANRIDDYLLALRAMASDKSAGVTPQRVAETAARWKLKPALLQRWIEATNSARDNWYSILYPWADTAKSREKHFRADAQALHHRVLEAFTAGALAIGKVASPRPDLLVANFDEFSLDGWTPLGRAFHGTPERYPRGWQGAGGRGFVSSYRATDAVMGQLVSAPLRIERPFLNLLISGGSRIEATKVYLVTRHAAVPVMLVDRYATGDGGPGWRYKTLDIGRYSNQEGVLVISDSGRAAGDHLRIDEMWFSDTPEMPQLNPHPGPNPLVMSWLVDPQLGSPRSLAQRYQAEFIHFLDSRQDELRRYSDALRADPEAADVQPPRARAEEPGRELLFRWIEQNLNLVGYGDSASASATQEAIAQLSGEKLALENSLPDSTLALVATARPRLNLPHYFPDWENQAGVGQSFFAALAAPNCDVASTGAGRLALANWIASADNPLTARVLVNRVWRHHFGHGLVDTPDNFGALGEKPSHPELLDYLALQFVKSGWSWKGLHRMILLSSSYRQSGDALPEALEKDPANRLVHSQRARRLDAECIRDAILSTAGTLNRKSFGPSVPLHVGPESLGDDLPKYSGPIDGDGRRSVYLAVRRNHITPILGVFDFPAPDRCIGRRDSSIVPAQALFLMNDPFVARQADSWARRLWQQTADAPARIRRLYQEGLGREPTNAEIENTATFLAAQCERYRRLPNQRDVAEVKSWADACQMIFNRWDFLFVR